jgi:hypothetical protein
MSEPTSRAPEAERESAPVGRHRLYDDDTAQMIDELIAVTGMDPETGDARFVRDLILTSLKLYPDGRDRGELKLMTAALKELRYAYKVFHQYPDVPKISVFGSARTPEDHPDYKACVAFSRRMAELGWGVITGAGDGIMKAGHEGPGVDASFGLAISLPFETTANTVIQGDPKLITFRYFFTRKLIFVSQAKAVAVFPGGFGTQDEIFEVLTLIQTGKSSMVPVVLIEGEGGDYWKHWLNYLEHSLLGYGFISPEDVDLITVCSTPVEAARVVADFYRVYHSSRYVRDDFVIRIKTPLKDEHLVALNEEFGELVRDGKIVQRGPFEVETDHLDLPRIAFTHTRRNYGVVRRLLDRINELGSASA